MPVVIVAASEDGGDGQDRPAGPGTVTACATSTTSYVSVSPPVLQVALRPDSRTAQMIERTGAFTVSLLAAGQVDLAQRAGRPSNASDKMADVGVAPEPPADGSGPPGVAGAAAVLWCSVTGMTAVGDHVVIFGEVRASRPAADSAPLLLRHQRGYLASGEPLSGYAPEGYPI
jgi:flavin reductase (DIM6/NTAB) family NADH-FMN oxidoreductase RutF